MWVYRYQRLQQVELLLDELRLFAHRDERTDVEVHYVHIVLICVNGAIVLLVLEDVDRFQRRPDVRYVDIQIV